MTGKKGIEREKASNGEREEEEGVLIQFRKSTHFKEESERDSKRQERERDLSTQKRYLISLG